MGAKPDPTKFKIQQREIVSGNLIILAHYQGCLTFGGYKLMVLRGTPSIGNTLDPHFLDEEYPVVARFIPNELGWKLARITAQNI